MVSPWISNFVFLISLCSAYEFIVWSDDAEKIERPLQSIIQLSSTESPVYIFSVFNFTLADLKKSNKFQDIVGLNHKDVNDGNKLHAHHDSTNVEYESFMNIDDVDLEPHSLQKNFVAIMTSPEALDISLSRSRRVSMNEDDDEDTGDRRGPSDRPAAKGRKPQKSRPRVQSFRTNGKTYRMPVVMPPFNVDKAVTPRKASPDWGSCLFYLEELVVYVFNKDSTTPRGIGAVFGKNSRFVFNEDSVNCIEPSEKSGNSQTFSFTVIVNSDKPVVGRHKGKQYFTVEDTISVKLTFKTSPGWKWRLIGIETDGFSVSGQNKEWLDKTLSVKSGALADEFSISYMDIGATYDYNYACSKTNTAVFRTNNRQYDIGIGFVNLQVQPYNYETNEDKTKASFSPKTMDCVGTFSEGSWMGIIVSVILATILIFAFLMLNSVQTMDRFDDPKQKQLQVNARE